MRQPRVIFRGAIVLYFVIGLEILIMISPGQVYYHKFAGKGVALGGLYSRIRHPQYLGLGLPV